MDIRCPPHTLQSFCECFTPLNILYRKEENFYTYSLRVGGILWLLKLIVVRSSPLLRSRLKNLPRPTSHDLCMVRFILTSISCFTWVSPQVGDIPKMLKGCNLATTLALYIQPFLMSPFLLECHQLGTLPYNSNETMFSSIY